MLGLPPGVPADENTIKSAFRQLAKVYHPDVPGTGDVTKFQQLHTAAKELMAGQGGGIRWDANSLEGLFSGSTVQQYASANSKPPSTAHVHIEHADFAGTRSGRVDVAESITRRATNLRQTPRIQQITSRASPQTLARVQSVLASTLGVAVDDPQIPLVGIGFHFEGGSVGWQSVADSVMALEHEFGLEILSILAGTWMQCPMPASVATVQDLADYIETKQNA